LPNLVTLEKKKTRVAAFLKNKMFKMAIGYVLIGEKLDTNAF
jgi:hypothetical protein